MNTGKTHFSIGNSAAKGKLGKKHKLTLFREKLGIKNIEDLKDDVLNVWTELLYSNELENRKYAVKEISKYIFSTQKAVEPVNKGVTISDLLNYAKDKEEKNNTGVKI